MHSLYALQRPDGVMFACGPDNDQHVQVFNTYATALRWAMLLAPEFGAVLTVVEFHA